MARRYKGPIFKVGQKVVATPGIIGVEVRCEVVRQLRNGIVVLKLDDPSIRSEAKTASVFSVHPSVISLKGL